MVPGESSAQLSCFLWIASSLVGLGSPGEAVAAVFVKVLGHRSRVDQTGDRAVEVGRGLHIPTLEEERPRQSTVSDGGYEVTFGQGGLEDVECGSGRSFCGDRLAHLDVELGERQIGKTASIVVPGDLLSKNLGGSLVVGASRLELPEPLVGSGAILQSYTDLWVIRSLGSLANLDELGIEVDTFLEIASPHDEKGVVAHRTQGFEVFGTEIALQPFDCPTELDVGFIVANHRTEHGGERCPGQGCCGRRLAEVLLGQLDGPAMNLLGLLQPIEGLDGIGQSAGRLDKCSGWNVPRFRERDRSLQLRLGLFSSLHSCVVDPEPGSGIGDLRVVGWRSGQSQLEPLLVQLGRSFVVARLVPDNRQVAQAVANRPRGRAVERALQLESLLSQWKCSIVSAEILIDARDRVEIEALTAGRS